MRKLSELLNRFHAGTDLTFEDYYSALLARTGSGAPSAEEARRDFESIRRIVSRAMVYRIG